MKSEYLSIHIFHENQILFRSREERAYGFHFQ